jgi:hypothetical protein
MITLTGFDMESFMYICALFRPLYNNYSPFIDENGYIVKKKTKRGRPHLMKAEDCLGLVLAWTCSRGCLVSLQLIPFCSFRPERGSQGMLRISTSSRPHVSSIKELIARVSI